MGKIASIIIIIIFICQDIGFGAEGDGLLRPAMQCSKTAKELIEIQNSQRKPKKYPTRESCEIALKERQEKKWPNNPSALAKGEHKDPALYFACRKFGIELPVKKRDYIIREMKRSLESTYADVRRHAKGKDYYKILGLPVDATIEDIRQRYIKLARIVHPDSELNPDEEVFKKISEAYETLSKPDTRNQYDEVMKNRVNIKMVENLERYLEDPQKADDLFYYDIGLHKIRSFKDLG